ncbi:MHYT domain-containing protein [Pseudomonas aeruginosa]|nr:PAS domain S-box protein [Pseudomonas aeruginosa]EKV3073154.1 PAS domain S-box protein [Pseudomonas aeruginosa]
MLSQADLFSGFFVHGAELFPYLKGEYHEGLVLLSLFVSVFSATMALQTAQIARRTEVKSYRYIALGTGSIALGGGIWTMHFIGMLAFELPIHIHYTTRLTLLSFIPACTASWLALRLLMQPEITTGKLIISGTLLGLGIGTMHYMGMGAISSHSPLLVRYDPLTFLLSIAIAIGLAILALWIRYRLRKTKLNRFQRFITSGFTMGMAIAGLHYIGMAAARFSGAPDTNQTSGLLLNSTYASIGLASFTITVTIMVAALNGLIYSRQLYRNIESSKARLRATLDTAVDGVITINSSGIIQEFNRSAERLFGWKAEEVLGKNIKILMPEPDQSLHDSYLENYHKSGIRKIIGIGRETTGLRKDGSLMPMRLAVGRMDLPGELLFVGFVTDISDHHALEASLRDAAAQAEQAAAAKSIFLANMSHEIRTPMNSIIGFTELLLQSNLTDIQRSQLDNICQSSRVLLRLINDILDTTKMEKGHLDLECTDFSLKALAFQIESSLWPSAKSKGLILSTHYPADMPENFQGDQLRILQVLINLVGNAIKFTELGSVEVLFDYENDMVHVQICDSGIGMTPQQVDSVFTPFTQADASISRRFGGTGLGTTIARQLVELMGGRIEAQSQLGKGSIFHIWLPLPLGRALPPKELTTEPVRLPSLRILIVDDVPQNLELLTLILKKSDHHITVAHNGDEAFKFFLEQKFDLILMDVHMPGTDGLQATQLIRQNERTQEKPRTPIIALTASVMPIDRKAAQQAGMDGFATKPLNASRLFEEINRVLKLPKKQPKLEKVPEDSLTPVIDWASGASLWGSEKRFLEALDLFLSEMDAKYPLSINEEPIDWEKILFNLHSIHGVTGNLALPTISELSRNLEILIREGSHSEFKSRLPDLLSIMEKARADFAIYSEAVFPSISKIEKATHGDIFLEIQKLIETLEHNELDEEKILLVSNNLEQLDMHEQARSLRNSIASFDFSEAHTLLQILINDHNDHSSRGKDS